MIGRSRRATATALLAAATVAGLATGCASLAPYDAALGALAEGRLLDLEEGRLHVIDQGSGEPVVLVHGFGASSYSWRLVDDALNAAGYRTLAVDLRGFGLTERPSGRRPYSRFEQGELVVQLLDALAIDRAHVVGHSYGGSVSMALAARRPERFLSLTLVDAAGIEYPQARRNVLAAVKPLSTLFVRAALSRRRVDRGLRRSAADDSIVTPELVDAYYRRLAIEGAPRAFHGLTAPFDDPQGAVEYEAITVPTLAIWGVEDKLISAEAARETARRIPQCAFVTLDGVGHIPMEEAPEALSRLLVDFLDHGLDGVRSPCEGRGVASDSSR